THQTASRLRQPTAREHRISARRAWQRRCLELWKNPLVFMPGLPLEDCSSGVRLCHARHAPLSDPPMTELLQPDAAGIARATTLLRKGRLVAFGTETVYGLGADATNDRAVAEIFAAKRRPRFNPLICHYPDAEAALADVLAGAQARILADAFLPGPLTTGPPRP